MQEFKVVIRETLERQISVKAKDRFDAVRRIRSDYAAGEIILSADDFTTVEITAEADPQDYTR